MLEYDDQREAGNSGFTSIPTTWYYICATMTTVGYGDHYPITPWGQFVGCTPHAHNLMVMARLGCSCLATIPPLLVNKKTAGA